MSEYILIIMVLHGYNYQPTSIPFLSKENCEKAAMVYNTKYEEAYGKPHVQQAFCVKR